MSWSRLQKLSNCAINCVTSTYVWWQLLPPIVVPSSLLKKKSQFRIVWATKDPFGAVFRFGNWWLHANPQRVQPLNWDITEKKVLVVVKAQVASKSLHSFTTSYSLWVLCSGLWSELIGSIKKTPNTQGHFSAQWKCTETQQHLWCGEQLYLADLFLACGLHQM